MNKIQLTEEQAKELINIIKIDNIPLYGTFQKQIYHDWKDKGYIAHVKTALEKAREYYSEVEKTVGNNELYSIYNIMCLKDLYEQAIKELQEGYNG